MIFTVIDNKKIIEFNGDFWHGNPNKYSKNDIISYPDNKKVLVEDLWKRDEIKNNFAESKGFEVLTIWEAEYRKDENNMIKKCLDFLGKKI